MAGKKKPLVVITRKLPDQVETRMRELFDARLNVYDKPKSQPELVAAFREALGTTRRFAMPLLGLLDAAGLTRRRGDLRIPGPRLGRTAPSGSVGGTGASA